MRMGAAFPSMWQPLAPKAQLERRAAILRVIREFFLTRNVLEVDVPVLAEHSVTDLHLDAFSVSIQDETHYLQTSPEFYMKRLLAAGYGDAYYLGKAFRRDEKGRYHRPEFTMLEWYRCGWDDRQLVDEVVALCEALMPSLVVTRCSYGDLFECHAGLNPHVSETERLAERARDTLGVEWQTEPRNTWLDVLFTHLVEPALPQGLVVVCDYPASQAALARTVEANGHSVARRFECFLNGIELANGYWELTDAAEQRRRFDEDNTLRRELKRPEREPDPYLLAALDAGLPECAGVALGVDRLVMGVLGLTHIEGQLSF